MGWGTVAHMRGVAAGIRAHKRRVQHGRGTGGHILQRTRAHRLAAPGHRDIGLVGYAADPPRRGVSNNLRPAGENGTPWRRDR